MSIEIKGGSEKQNAWATDIVATWMKELYRELTRTELRNKEGDQLEWYEDNLKALKEKLEANFSNLPAKHVIDLEVRKKNPVKALITAARQREPVTV